jgi:hypothetical protein
LAQPGGFEESVPAKEPSRELSVFPARMIFLGETENATNSFDDRSSIGNFNSGNQRQQHDG